MCAGFPAAGSAHHVENRTGADVLILEVGDRGPGDSVFYPHDDLAAAMTATAGAELVMPERTTFYGSREFGIKDPAGHFLTFAQFGS